MPKEKLAMIILLLKGAKLQNETPELEEGLGCNLGSVNEDAVLPLFRKKDLG
jgi:hypothetical protein